MNAVHITPGTFNQVIVTIQNDKIVLDDVTYVWDHERDGFHVYTSPITDHVAVINGRLVCDVVIPNVNSCKADSLWKSWMDTPLPPRSINTAPGIHLTQGTISRKNRKPTKLDECEKDALPDEPEELDETVQYESDDDIDDVDEDVVVDI